MNKLIMFFYRVVIFLSDFLSKVFLPITTIFFFILDVLADFYNSMINIKDTVTGYIADVVFNFAYIYDIKFLKKERKKTIMIGERINAQFIEYRKRISQGFYLLDREDGPAFVRYFNGMKLLEKWYREGLTHREDGPSIIKYSYGKVIEERWTQRGRLHREDGPAVIFYDHDGQIKEKKYYIKGQEVMEEDVKLTLEMKNSRNINKIKDLLKK